MPQSCPNPDLLLALDEGVLPESLSNDVREHVSGCAMCASLRRDLLDLASTAEPGEASPLREAAPPRRGTLGYLAAAAGIVFITSIYLWRSHPIHTPEPASVRKEPTYRIAVTVAPLRLPFSAAMVLRGQGETASQEYLKELGKALDPYHQAKYSEAATNLNELRKRYPKAVEPPFYQGVAMLLSNDAQASLEPLETARLIGGEALNDDIAWYLAAARERTGEWPKAAALLESLCRNEGIHRQQACMELETK